MTNDQCGDGLVLVRVDCLRLRGFAGLLAPLALAPAPGTPAGAGDPTIPLREQQAAGPAHAEPAPLPPAEAAAARPARDGGFDIFDVHRRLISDYRGFTEGAAVIVDDRIAAFVEQDLDAKSQWPDPWLSLIPSFADGGSVADLADSGVLHPLCKQIFQSGKTPGSVACDGQPIRFYRHQRDAIEAARQGPATC